MRVLLTGGAGFIGSRVAEHLLTRGRQVVIERQPLLSDDKVSLGHMVRDPTSGTVAG